MHNSISMVKESPTSAITTTKHAEKPYSLALKKKKSLVRMRKRERSLAKEIQALQQNGENIIPAVSFSRVVREILQEMGDFSMRGEAMKALQCASESKLTDMFAEAHKLANYQKRDTVIQSDIHFIVPQRDRLVNQTTEDADTVEDTECPLPENDQ